MLSLALHKHVKQYNLLALIVASSIKNQESFAFYPSLQCKFENNRIAHRKRQGGRLYSHSKSFCSTSIPKTKLISYITDIEGDAMYFDRFVNTSKVLKFESVEPNFCRSSKDYFPYDKHVVFQDEIIDDDSFGFNVNHLNTLVFGGDLWDKGGSDLYCMRQLLSLQKRYGEDRVHFVMGNRDINKMRILEELGINIQQNGQDDVLPNHGGVYWFKGTGLQGDPDLIQQYCNTYDESLKYALVPNDAAERLKWILRMTMGSPDAFEFRRGELQRERLFERNYERSSLYNVTEETDHEIYEISDEDVVQSYKSSCHPVRGILGDYLSRAKLCVKIGNSAFMHGALPFGPDIISIYHNDYQIQGKNLSLFWKEFYRRATPFGGKENVGYELEPIYNLDDWIDTLNAFAKDQVNSWIQNITAIESVELEEESEEKITKQKAYMSEHRWVTVGGYLNTSKGSREFGSLCAYGMGWKPDRTKNPTCVYNSWITDGMPQRFYGNGEQDIAYQKLVNIFFQESGLDTIVCGHQPVGDHPFLIRLGEGQDKLIVCADTSYSGDTKWMVNDRCNVGRGKSVSGRGDVSVTEVLLEQNVDSGELISLHTHGTLSDGSSYRSVNVKGEDIVGTLVDRRKLCFEGSIQEDSNDKIDWFTKTHLSDGTYLVTTGRGYEVFNSIARVK
jgi:hypothetical protein